MDTCEILRQLADITREVGDLLSDSSNCEQAEDITRTELKLVELSTYLEKYGDSLPDSFQPLLPEFREDIHRSLSVATATRRQWKAARPSEIKHHAREFSRDLGIVSSEDYAVEPDVQQLFEELAAEFGQGQIPECGELLEGWPEKLEAALNIYKKARDSSPTHGDQTADETVGSNGDKQLSRKMLRELLEERMGLTDKQTQMRIKRGVDGGILKTVGDGFTSESVAEFLEQQKPPQSRSPKQEADPGDLEEYFDI